MLPIKEILDADVVIVGGGVGGLMAAVSAARNGAGTIVLEKANTKRSGSGAGGNDHFACYIPEVHGDLATARQATLESMVGPDQDRDVLDASLERSLEIIEMWHSWGIDMKLGRNGGWLFEGHAFPGKPRVFLKYNGSNQKKVLTEQARKAGAVIVNHSPVLEMLPAPGGGMGGVLALDTTEERPAFRIVRARAVIMAAGNACRLFVSANTPGLMFNVGVCPANTGESIAQFWRIGGALVGMDRGYRHAGPRYSSRCGKSTWIGVYRYPNGEPIGPFTSRPSRETSDITGDIWNSSFSDLMVNGRGPAMMDCAGASREDLDHMLWAMGCEGMTGFVSQMKAEGVDPGRHGVVFGQYEPHGIRGIEINPKTETNLPGVYAVGDHIGNFRTNIGGAAVFGYISGEQAAAYVKGRELCGDIENTPWARERMVWYSKFGEREQGAAWQECNHAIQQILSDFAAPGPHKVRSASLLNSGLKFIGDLRVLIERQLAAPTAHELMRAAETLAIVDMGEIMIRCALERRESRGNMQRSDYTFTNPLLNNKFIRIVKENGEPHITWRDIRR